MKKIILALAILFSASAHSAGYWASYGTYNNCYDQTGGLIVSCGYASSPSSACSLFGGILLANNVILDTQIPFTATVTETSCRMATGQSIGTVNFHNDVDCSYVTAEGHCSSAPPQPLICSDGLPPDLLGYPGCDRPGLKQCMDGAIVEAETGICTQICWDFQTCYDYAYAQGSCSSAQYVDFNYINPDTWEVICNNIDVASVDHPDNGGNADGNIYNDPTSPPAPTISDSNPSDVGGAVSDALQDDLSNVERAIREGTTSSTDDTNRIIDSLNDFNTSNAQHLGDIDTTIGDGTGNIVGAVNGVRDAVYAGNATLGQISGKLDNLSPCIPTLENNYCENPHGLDGTTINQISDAIQGTFDSEKQAALDAVKGEIQDIESAAPLGTDIVDGIFDYFTNIIPAPQACIPLVFGDSSKPYSFTVTCDFSDKFKAIFGFLIAIYTILQLIEILMTGIRPKLNGGA